MSTDDLPFVGPLTAREAFFAEHAGVGYQPRVETFEQGQRRGARELAAAERWLLDSADLRVGIEDDPFPWDGDVPWDGPLYVVSIWRDRWPDSDEPQCVASLGSVAVDGLDAPYLRVVAAELADELLYEQRRDTSMDEFDVFGRDCDGRYVE